MNTSVRLLTGILAASLASAASGGFSECEVDGAGTFKVFLLAGQSNMEGHAVVDLDHPDHYNKGIEVIDYIDSWDFNFTVGNIIKYVSRHKHKAKPLEDLKKAKWYLDRLIKNYEDKK